MTKKMNSLGAVRLLCAFLIGLLFNASVSNAHPGHEHSPELRVWHDANGQFEIRASFVLTRDNRVLLSKQDGSTVWLSFDKLCEADRVFVNDRTEAVRRLNGSKVATEPVAADVEESRGTDASRPSTVPIVFAMSILTIFALAGKRLRRRSATLPVLGTMIVFGSLCLGEVSKGSTMAPPAIQKHFEPFKDKLKFRSDHDFLYVESDGMPDHPLMVGIRAWQQQVPLPQQYRGRNAWRIPLHPEFAKEPVSAKTALFRGAIAFAVNGVPIFNPIKNDGRTDTYLAGELDEFGGHCGRADDYHYHIAPVHLQKIVGRGNPIAYALDGFPLYGYTDAAGNEPKDLDDFNGRMEPDGYRYYSTRKYPYINGGMRGVVTVRGDQIDPQPRANPVRPAGEPLRGAKITGFVRDDEKKQYALTYNVRGQTRSIKYSIKANGTFAFAFDDGAGNVREEIFHSRRDGAEGQNQGRRKTGDDDERPAKKKGERKRDVPRDDDDRPPTKKKKGKGEPRPVDDAPDGPAVMLTPKHTGNMTLTSPAVVSGDPLPTEFTGDGVGATLPLEWRGVPKETQSFALVMDHQARDGMKCYWLLWDIPVSVTHLAKNTQGIGKLGATWKRDESYVPPHSQGPGAKTYTLTLYALSAAPRIEPTNADVTRNVLLTAIKDMIVDSAELKVTYSRSGDGDDDNQVGKGKSSKKGRRKKDDS